MALLRQSCDATSCSRCDVTSCRLLQLFPEEEREVAVLLIETGLNFTLIFQNRLYILDHVEQALPGALLN